MNKNLKIIQLISKIFKIINKIAFICCIVGVIFSIAGAIVFKVIPLDFTFDDGRTAKEIIETEGGVTVNTIFVTFVIAAILCAFEAVVSRFNEIYFRNELAAGTPFTYQGAKEMFALAVVNFAIPFLSSITCASIFAVLKSQYTDVEQLFELNGFESLPISVCYVIFSIVFKYGADLENK